MQGKLVVLFLRSSSFLTDVCLQSVSEAQHAQSGSPTLFLLAVLSVYSMK